MRTENRRDYFRLKFPEGDGLRFTMQGTSHIVAEIAERSIQITACGLGHRGEHCEGLIEWSDGSASKIEGEIGPVRDGKQFLINIDGIEGKKIFAEQRRLLNNYVTVKSQEAKSNG